VRDRPFLNWPFFEDRHRAFALRLRDWLDSRHGEASTGHGEVSNHAELVEGRWNAEETAKAWVESLAQNRFLQPCLDLDVRTLCIARETLAAVHPLADFAFAMQGLGSGPISLFGTDEQKSKYLPAVARGEKIAAFAISEREAGSDVAAVETRASRNGGEYVIDGEKTWISNAGIANFYILFARTSDDGAKGLSAFIVDANTAGLEVAERIETISPHPLGSLRFSRCRVPVENRLAQEGRGFKIAMATLDLFRSTVGAAAVGFAQRALDDAITHVRERKLFGQRLGDMQLTQAKIAEMATGIDASRLLVYRAAHAKDMGAERVTREAAMAKWYATETASRVADAAVQLFGGRGVVKGSGVERINRDVRALRIYEGASEIQQIVIARSLLEERD
jgi:acyl-CoA dehydrogenase